MSLCRAERGPWARRRGRGGRGGSGRRRNSSENHFGNGLFLHLCYQLARCHHCRQRSGQRSFSETYTVCKSWLLPRSPAADRWSLAELLHVVILAASHFYNSSAACEDKDQSERHHFKFFISLLYLYVDDLARVLIPEFQTSLSRLLSPIFPRIVFSPLRFIFLLMSVGCVALVFTLTPPHPLIITSVMLARLVRRRCFASITFHRKKRWSLIRATQPAGRCRFPEAPEASRELRAIWPLILHFL